MTETAASNVARSDNTSRHGSGRIGWIAVATVVLVVVLGVGAAGASSGDDAARYLESHQVAGGGFAEPGGPSTPGLTAWAVLALRAAGRTPDELSRAVIYLERTAAGLTSLPDIELAALALASAGVRPPELLERIRDARHRDGSVGSLVNTTAWGVLALRAAGDPTPEGASAYLLARQRKSGGWGWHPGVSADSNDTAAAMQALRAAGIGTNARAIVRGVAYLRSLQNADGGFELVEGRGSDVQSTAWAIQALVAAGRKPGAPATRYLARMRRADGSFRYSARYAVTPVWVTAQALPALLGKPLPLR